MGGLLLATSLAASAVVGMAPPGGSIPLRGEITPRSVDAVVKRLARTGRARPRWIVVNSAGGDVVAAIRLARFMHRHGVSLYVERICASSCANYLFPAARTKVIGPGALIGWHGSPASEALDGPRSLDATQRQAFETSRRAVVARERRLFAELAIDPRLLCVGDRTMRQLHALGWTMPVEAMARFGVKGVIATGSAPIPWRFPKLADSMVVIDPQPDCARTYEPISRVSY